MLLRQAHGGCGGSQSHPCPIRAAQLTCAIPPTIFSFTTTVSSWSWKAAAFCAAFTRLSDALFTALPAACSREEGERQRKSQPQGTTDAGLGGGKRTAAPGWSGRQDRQPGGLGAAGRDSFKWLAALPLAHDHFRHCCSQPGSGSCLSRGAGTGGQPLGSSSALGPKAPALGPHVNSPTHGH